MKIQQDKLRVILIIVAIAGAGLIVANLNIGGPSVMNGGSRTGRPYGMVLYPVSGTEIGYTTRSRISASYRSTAFFWKYTYEIPIKYLVHDTDGDLEAYSIMYKLQEPSVTHEDYNPKVYQAVTSQSRISGTLYDREITTSISISVTRPSHATFDIVILTHFIIEDKAENLYNKVYDRPIVCKTSEEDDLNVPDGIDDDPIIENNDEEPIQDHEEYLDDPLGNFVDSEFWAGQDLVSFEFVFAIIPIIYLASRKKRDD